MAITVNTSPDQYSPVYNPVGFNVSSTNYAQSNFNFIADIYINSAVTMTARLKFPAYPSTDDGYLDIGGVLKNYLTSNVFTPTETGFNKCGNSILRYDIQWGEQYGPSSGITTYPNLQTSNGYAFNGSLEHINLGTIGTITDWLYWESSTYTYFNTITFLTNAPRSGVSIRSGDDYAIYFLNTGTNYAFDATIVYKNSAGSTIGTQTLTNSFATVGLYDTRLLRVACGPANITVPANTAYYLVNLRDNLTNNTSETFRFNIDESCSKAVRNYRLIFKNQFGGFDAFNFMGQYERSMEIKKDYYRTIGGEWASGRFGYAVNYRSEKQYNTIVQDVFKVYSGWITEKESNWLNELVASPEVYVVYPYTSERLATCTIIDTNYTYKTTSRDQLFNLEISFRPSFNKVRQQF